MTENPDALVVRPDATLQEFGQIHDIPLQISIEIGRIQLRVRDLMKLSPNVVIELKKAAGEPFDICVNGVTVARGEVTMVDQASSVRLIEVQKPGSLR